MGHGRTCHLRGTGKVEKELEAETFEAELAAQGLSFFKQKPISNVEYHRKIVESWNRIFALNLYEPDLAEPFHRKSIQATVWELSINQVRNYKHFISRWVESPNQAAAQDPLKKRHRWGRAKLTCCKNYKLVPIQKFLYFVIPVPDHVPAGNCAKWRGSHDAIFGCALGFTRCDSIFFSEHCKQISNPLSISPTPVFRLTNSDFYL